MDQTKKVSKYTQTMWIIQPVQIQLTNVWNVITETIILWKMSEFGEIMSVFYDGTIKSTNIGVRLSLGG